MARYIDADELIAQIEGNTADTWGRGLGRTWWSHSVMLKDNIVNLIRNAPTADVAPREEVSREIFEEIDELVFQHGRGDLADKYFYAEVEKLKEKYLEG